MAAQAQWPLIEIFSRTFSQGMNLDRFDGPDVVSRREREAESEAEGDEKHEYFTEPLT